MGVWICAVLALASVSAGQSNTYRLSTLASTLALAAQTAPLEYQAKAAFLFNFTKFIEWPQTAFAGRESPFRICIAGDSPFEDSLVKDSLVKIVEGERVNSRPFVVEKLGREEPAAHCQIVFFGASGGSVQETIPRLGPGVLTVGESDDFLRNGGVIRFVSDNRRVRFDVNQAAAKRANLRISSRLLRIAREVENGGGR